MTDSQVPDLSAVASPPRRTLEYDDVETVGRIGEGGQAVVHEARVPDADPPDRVALKEPAQEGTLTREAVESFFAEVETWQTLDDRERETPRWSDSEHVVGIVDTGDALPWIALEYMDGGSLADRLEASDGGLPVDEALWIGRCVCRGVELAHNYGIAHLDLKPENVLFRETPAGRWDVPKIADWGLARNLAERAGSAEGYSVSYAAPEQFEPERFGDADTLTDVYQVGALVYALLAGRPPYTGSRLDVASDAVDEDRPSAPSAHRPGLPRELDAVVLTALEASKADRYQSITSFRTALEAVSTDDPFPPVVARRLDRSDRRSATGPSGGDRASGGGLAADLERIRDRREEGSGSIAEAIERLR